MGKKNKKVKKNKRYIKLSELFETSQSYAWKRDSRGIIWLVHVHMAEGQNTNLDHIQPDVNLVITD